MCSEVWQVHGTVCNYTLVYAHLNGTYQGWGVIATMNGIVCQHPWTFRPSCYARRLPIDTCLVSKKFYKSPLTNYDFGVAMGGLFLKLQNFKKVKLIFGHPVLKFSLGWCSRLTYMETVDLIHVGLGLGFRLWLWLGLEIRIRVRIKMVRVF